MHKQLIRTLFEAHVVTRFCITFFLFFVKSWRGEEDVDEEIENSRDQGGDGGGGEGERRDEGRGWEGGGEGGGGGGEVCGSYREWFEKGRCENPQEDTHFRKA